jgi:acyl-CoA thioesterase-1
MYSEIAKAEKVALLPLLVDARIATDPDLMQADGLHPNPAAQPLLLDKVWPVLQPLLQDTRQDTPRP